MSVYRQIFQNMDFPMLVIRQNNQGVSVEDANHAFVRLTGYTVKELRSEKCSLYLKRYNIDTTATVLKSEINIMTKNNRQLFTRLNQQPLPRNNQDGYTRSYVIFEDLTPYRWIQQQSEINKVLISGIVDRHQHIRLLRDSLSPLLFEADRNMTDETLLQFITETEHGSMKEVLQEATLNKQERSLTLKTTILSGVELMMSATFTPILDGFGEVLEFAFVIWDLSPINDQIDPSLKLRIWMAKKDMTAGHLSASTGISIQTISKLRNGKILKPKG